MPKYHIMCVTVPFRRLLVRAYSLCLNKISVLLSVRAADKCSGSKIVTFFSNHIDFNVTSSR